MNKELIKVTIEHLNEIADELYKGSVNQGIASMNSVIPSLATVASEIEEESIKRRLLNDALTPILESMEQQDGTQIADLIVYELIELLEEL